MLVKSDPHRCPAIEPVGFHEIAPFVASRAVVILLIGSTAPHSFLLPLCHHYAARHGDDIRFGYLRLATLAERARALPHVACAFPAQHRRPRAARSGYYLFSRGRPVAFHCGLNDPSLAWLSALAAGAIDHSQAVQRFQHAARQICLAIIASFDPLLSPTPPSRRSDREARSAAVIDPYQVLGLPESATDAEIKRAYHARLRESHPDLLAHLAADAQQQGAQRAQSVISAYRLLSRRRATGRR